MQKKKKKIMMRDMNMIKMKGSVLSDKQLQTHIRSKYNEDDDDDIRRSNRDDDDRRRGNRDDDDRRRGNRDDDDRRRGNRDDDRDVGDYNDNNYDRHIIKDDANGKDRQISLIRRDKVISKR